MRGEQCYDAVLTGLAKYNYRHIDTASIYRNEDECGKALKQSNIPREEVFITSKLSPMEHGYENAIQACHRSLQRLGVSYLDLYLIHWPGVTRTPADSERNAIERRESWRAMQYLYRTGKCRAIGVSNYSVRHLQELLQLCSSSRRDNNEDTSHVIPMVNQVEIHPLYPQLQLRKFCAEHGIVVEAYSSLGQGTLLNHPQIMRISQLANIPLPSMLLRWAWNNDLVIMPKSSNEWRIMENILAVSESQPLPSKIKFALDNLTLSDVVVNGEVIPRCIERKTAWDPNNIL